MTPTAGWDRQTIRRDCADPSLLPGNCMQLHVLFRDTSYAGVMTNTIRETGRRRLRRLFCRPSAWIGKEIILSCVLHQPNGFCASFRHLVIRVVQESCTGL